MFLQGMRMLTMLREYMETEGRSILISSHISSDLEDFCDDIYMIDEGKNRYARGDGCAA